MADPSEWEAIRRNPYARGTKEYRQYQAYKARELEDMLKYRGATLESLGIKDEEGANRPIFRTIGAGGLFSQYGNINTNYRYDWARGKKLNIATNVGSQTPESQMNSNGQWVFNPETANSSRWEDITPDEYAEYRGQQQWNAQNPGMSYADRLAQQGMQEGVRAGHWTLDPKSGNYYNLIGNNPNNVEWKDRFGRRVGGTSGFRPPQAAPGKPPGGAAPSKPPLGGAMKPPSTVPATKPYVKGTFSYGSDAPIPSTQGAGVSTYGGPVKTEGASASSYGPSIKTMPALADPGPASGGNGGGGGLIDPNGFRPVPPDGGVQGGPAGGPVQMAPGGYGYGQPFAPGGGTDYSGILGPYLGSEAQLNQEMLRQAQLDTLSQNEQLQYAMLNRAQAAPMENYLKDFYGGIMGIGWDPVQNQGISDYFNSGVGSPGQSSTTPGSPTSAQWQAYQQFGVDPSQGTPPWYKPMTNGVLNPNGSPGPNMPPGGVQLPPGTGGSTISPATPSGGSGVIHEEPPNGMTPQDYWNAQGGFPDGVPTWFTQWQQSGGAPWQNGGGWPSQPGATMNVPQAQGMPSPSNLPTLNSTQGGYHQLKGPAFDAGQRNTWALMAPYAQGVTGDMNAAIERLKRELPEGGERDAAIADLTRSGMGGLAQGRQGMMTEALGNINSLMQQKKFNVPVAPYTGSGQSMLGAYSNRYNTDVGAATSRYAANLGASTSRYSTDRQYSLGLQQLKSQNNPWNAIMGTIGALGGGLLGNSGLFK